MCRVKLPLNLAIVSTGLSLTFFVSASPTIALAQLAKDSPVKSVDANRAIEDFRLQLEKLNEDYAAASKVREKAHLDEVQMIKADLLHRLEDARKKATLADQLDDAIKIRDLIAEYSRAQETTTKQPSGESRQPPGDKKRLEPGKERITPAMKKKKEELNQQQDLIRGIAFRLRNSKWHNAQDEQMVMGFNADDTAFGWAKEPGTWTVDADGSVLIKWQGGLNWVLHVNPGFTAATAVNQNGQGNRLKLSK